MSPTTKLYDLDSYVKEFDAEVLSCEPVTSGRFNGLYELILDRTAFFPEGGGQSADTGYITYAKNIQTYKFRVVDVHISDGIIRHYVKADFCTFSDQSPDACADTSDENESTDSRTPAPGTKVKGIIDFNIRFDRMQQHSGEHLLSGYVSRTFGFSNVGFHLSDEVTTVDFDGTFSDPDIKSIEKAVNEAICSNTKCEIFYPSSDALARLEYRSKKELEGAVRIVRFGDYDTCACCAPHVASTGEIGSFKILSSEHFRGGTRMTIVCGMRAVAAFSAFWNSARSISQLLSVKPTEIAEGVTKLKDSEKDLKFENIRIEKELFAEKVRLLRLLKNGADAADPVLSEPAFAELGTNKEPLPFIFTERSNTDNAREAVNMLTEAFPGYCGVFTGNDTEGYSFIIGSKTGDCTVLMKDMKDKLKASGGGKPGMIQGRVGGSKESILAFLLSILTSF